MNNRAGRRATASAMIANYRAQYAFDFKSICYLHDDVIFAIIAGSFVEATIQDQDHAILQVMRATDKLWREHGVSPT